MEYKDKNLQALLNAFNSDPVDALGSAKQELDLAKENYEKKRQDLLDQKTFGKHQGELYEANIIEVKETERLDYKGLYEDLIKVGKIKVPNYYIKKHTKDIPSTSRVNIKFIGGK
tara:strand:+ start:83 stop:427 length:345 start_codon:yes stop_codon:yes gene_type:complete